MAKVKECLGQYACEGECMTCALAFLCIETAIEIDGHFDAMADRQKEIEEMEADYAWHEWQ